jgi:integrase
LPLETATWHFLWHIVGAQMNLRRGSVKRHGRYYVARITITDPATGQRRDVRRRGDHQADAYQLLNDLRREIDATGTAPHRLGKVFSPDLTSHYLTHYVTPPKYRDGKKISGLRSHKSVRGYVRILELLLGPTPLRRINFKRLRDLRAELFALPKKNGRQRSIANVNRILAALRAMLYAAEHLEWISKNPFTKARGSGETLISLASEKKRSRIVSYDEELQLLAACIGPRAHLRPKIVCAIESGMRENEIKSIERRDIDFGSDTIPLRDEDTKTNEARVVPFTDRLKAELRPVVDRMRPDPRAKVFPGDTKRAFQSAKRLGGITDLRWGDFRHTYATRMDQGGLSQAQIANLLGHSEVRTTYRYTNLDAVTLQKSLEVSRQIHQPKNPAGERAGLPASLVQRLAMLRSGVSLN